MPRSFHARFSQLKEPTKRQLDELAKDPESILAKFSKKSQTKKRVVAKGRESKKAK